MKKNKRLKETNPRKPRNFSGQHLIYNKHLINEMVVKAGISRHDTVFDLGAGKGALTQALSEKAKKVFAVEYDNKFVDILERKFINSPNTKVIHQDILRIHFPKEPFTVVSNIPFSITTPVMKMLLSRPTNKLQRALVVMEKGAAKRFTSSFVKDSYIIAWKMWFDIRFIKGISRNNFTPPPKVDAAIIIINRKTDPIVPFNDYLIFWGLVDYVFQFKELSIDLALRGLFTPPQIKQLKRNLGVKNEIPVSALSEKQWGLIYETMVKHVPKFRWPKINRTKTI